MFGDLGTNLSLVRLMFPKFPASQKQQNAGMSLGTPFKSWIMDVMPTSWWSDWLFFGLRHGEMQRMPSLRRSQKKSYPFSSFHLARTLSEAVFPSFCFCCLVAENCSSCYLFVPKPAEVAWHPVVGGSEHHQHHFAFCRRLPKIIPLLPWPSMFRVKANGLDAVEISWLPFIFRSGEARS